MVDGILICTDMIDWPYFTQGEPLSATKLRKLVLCCRELERLAVSCRLQGGAGYTFSRGGGGTTISIPRRGRGRGKGGGTAFPFACSIVTEDGENEGGEVQKVQIAKNGGVLLDVDGKPLEIKWDENEVVKVSGSETEGDFVVALGWKYKIEDDGQVSRTVECKTSKITAGADPEEDEALKPVVTPITGEGEEGESQVILAVGTAKKVTNEKGGEEIDLKITQQLVFSSLRAYWLPGYVKKETGHLGQYADVSISIYSQKVSNK